MSRTAHHRPPAHCRAAGFPRDGAPWRAVVLYDLRYDRHGVPRRIRREVTVYSWARHHRDGSVRRWAVTEERRARQRLRTALGAARRLANTARQDADSVDIPPARHRRAALWWA
ncbi:hypothetical protein [Streptomyces sp. NPDC127114]|uniref:hypothetical protein n=1 Tax=Streptomyces sp. NPDC127114 TaxID=3345366 RepID=UPI003625581D